MRDVRLQACLNGVRRPDEVPGLPVTPEQLARAAAEAVAAGADGVHLHPRGSGGTESLHPDDVGAAVHAVRAAVPDVEIGVTTGLWATGGDARARATAVAGWAHLETLPDAASVNWHEDGAEELAALLLDIGVAVEAGLWTVDAAGAFLAWPRRAEVRRVLVEATAQDPERAVSEAAEIAGLVDGVAPLLVHGEDAGAWPVLRWSAARGHAVRIGLEDSLVLPDGTPAAGNAALVEAASRAAFPA